MTKPLRRTLAAASSQSSPAGAGVLSLTVPANAHVLPSMKPGTGQSCGTAQNRSGISL